MGRLDELDLSLKLSKSESGASIAQSGKRLTELRLALGGKLPGYEDRLGPPVAVVFEGWDASGKGGALKRLVARSTRATCASLNTGFRLPTRSGTTFFGGSFRRCPAGAG